MPINWLAVSPVKRVTPRSTLRMTNRREAVTWQLRAGVYAAVSLLQKKVADVRNNRVNWKSYLQ